MSNNFTLLPNCHHCCLESSLTACEPELLHAAQKCWAHVTFAATMTHSISWFGCDASQAAASMHAVSRGHNDIKPEQCQILLYGCGANATCKLVDLGSSTTHKGMLVYVFARLYRCSTGCKQASKHMPGWLGPVEQFCQCKVIIIILDMPAWTVGITIQEAMSGEVKLSMCTVCLWLSCLHCWL